MSDVERWDRIQALFHAAVELPPTERAAFLGRECAGDAELERTLLAMIDADERADSLLEGGVADAASRVLEEAPPLRIGAYRIGRLLGEGGMGVVYRGEREDLGSAAAIKILRDAWLSPARRERFRAEQRTLAQLDHPSIARLYDADTLPDGTPWFVMELIEGVAITDHCAAAGLGVRDRLRLFRAACEAVRHAHGHAIIHRDIKPSNILVRPDGAVKLLDFGIAKQLESVDPADRTRTGLRLMTPGYAAPEQLRGGALGTHTDVYALGVLLYELLAGTTPFAVEGRSPSEVERAILEEEPARPSSRATRATGASRREWVDLDVLCLTAMHREPERRYRTVDAVIRDVGNFLEGRPLDARPESVAYRVGKFARRNRGRIAAVAAVVVVALGTTAFYTVRLTIARDEAVSEATRARRIQAFMLNLFQGGDDEAGPADSLRVVALLDRGVREARALDAEPPVQAELFATLGDLYVKLGRLGAADTLLSAALELRRGLAGTAGESGDVADRLVALGLLRAEQADYELADSLVRAGLDMGRRTRPDGHPALTAASTALGQVLHQRGEYDESVAVLEEAVRLAEAEDPSAELATALTELAAAHFYAGRYPVSDSINRRLLELSRALYGERHPHVADDLISLGAIRFEQGLYADAERYYRDALDLKEAWYGAEHPAVASNLTMLGRALVFEERYDEAVATLERSLAIQERAYGTMHPRVASAVNELGNVAMGRGLWDEAEARFSRMAAIYDAVHGAEHYLPTLARSNLASVYLARGDNARAEQVFRQVVRGFTAAQGPEHSNTAIARLKLGRSLLRQQRFDEAAAESRAGYEILIRQTEGASSFLRAARQDLATAHQALGQTDLAERFRKELEGSG